MTRQLTGTPNRATAVVALGLALAACAQAPTDQVAAPEAIGHQDSGIDGSPRPEATYDPIDSREQAPNVELTTGGTGPLFEPFDHGAFSNPTEIDNPWLPLEPGMRLVHEGFTREEGETTPHRLVSTVTDLVKEIDGVPSRVVWEVDHSDGELVETELAFYAQDDRGSVWRMGEYPEEWEDGEFEGAPAWIAGVDGARAGIAMPARPRLGADSYSQGWAPAADFTDRAFTYQRNVDDCVPVGCFSRVLVNDEFNAEEPGAHQLKYYARGVGNIRVGWRGNDIEIEELELVEVEELTPVELQDVRRSAMTLERRAYIVASAVYGPTEPSAQQDGG